MVSDELGNDVILHLHLGLEAVSGLDDEQVIEVVADIAKIKDSTQPPRGLATMSIDAYIGR